MDTEGETVAHMIYDPWGSPLIETYADTNLSGLENLNNFTGYTWDETLGFYFAQNRFYDPTTHRFTQEDVIKDGSNWYVYCANSPCTVFDMHGLSTESQNIQKNYDDLYGILKKQYPALHLDVNKTRFKKVKKALTDNKNTIIEVAEKYDIPAEMIAAIIVKEQMTQSVSDDVAYAHTFFSGASHSYGLGAIFPTTAYEAWLYLATNNVTDFALREYYKKIFPLLEKRGHDPHDEATLNVVLGAQLMSDEKFNIETIAVILRYNYERVKNNYSTYEEYYFVLFSCDSASVNRAGNVWLVSDIYAGFTREIYGHTLSYYNTGGEIISVDQKMA